MGHAFPNSQLQNREVFCGGTVAEMMQETSAAALPTRVGLYRRVIMQWLEQLQRGELVVHDISGTRRFGAPDTGLRVNVRIHDARFYGRVLRSGSMGVAESYLDGEWSTDNLTGMLRLFLQNQNAMNSIGRGRSWLANGLARIAHLLRDNSLAGSRRNIHEHYDLGNDFFRLFLDETMMYSSAFFAEEDYSLKQASEAKLDIICRKLQLGPQDHVLEIGTGWGGFAEYAAKNFGCHVTTTTISAEQYAFARERIDRAGLADRVTLLQQDYRDLTGVYDKLVSIEMIEAVGLRHLDEYFRVCADRLKPEGVMLIQAITIPDQRFEQYSRSVDFIQKYIFPGGALPSIGAMQQSTSGTDLRLVDLADFASHYARTLREWRDRFFARRDEILSLSFDERFLRMWEYYFCYCEAAFAERATGVAHLVFAKPEARLEVQ